MTRKTKQLNYKQMEKEFKNKFYSELFVFFPSSNNKGGYQVDEKLYNDLKSFLKQTLKSAMEGVVEAIKEIPTKNPKKESDEYDEGRKDFQQDIINKLNKIIKEIK